MNSRDTVSVISTEIQGLHFDDDDEVYLPKMEGLHKARYKG
jgi:hypothetical protein